MPQVTRKQAAAATAAVDDFQHLSEVLQTWKLKTSRAPGSWYQQRAKFLRDVPNINSDNNKSAPYSIFTKGNSKLPFYSFSTLPGTTCPGAGKCLTPCYSFKSWRYPAAFFRQLQNTILIRSIDGPLDIAAAFFKLPLNATLRLYVDGDIENVQQLQYWFKLLKKRPDIKAYGYSKSWEVFDKYARLNARYSQIEFPWPKNYMLNISNGSKYDTDGALMSRILALPITRGPFRMYQIKTPQTENPTQYAREVRAAAAADTGPARVFVCPGKCGTCTSKGHACGIDTFDNFNIAIGIH